MAPANRRDVTTRLSKRLANFKLGEAAIKRLTDRVLIDGLSIAWFNPCIYGICIDYVAEEMPKLDVLSPKLGITKWEVFPYGIIDWDHFHVRIAFQVDELEGKGLVGGFER
jgi:hypothetical protein